MQNSCKVCNDSFDHTGIRSWCSIRCKKVLKSRYDRERYEGNRQETIDKAKRWYTTNTDRKKIYDQNRRKNNPEYIKELREAYKAVRVVDPEKAILASARRRALKRGSGSFRVGPKDFKRLLDISKSVCTYCRIPFTENNPLEWDHVIPLSRGGTHSIGNLVPACMQCNRSKQSKFLVEWRYGRVYSARTQNK